MIALTCQPTNNPQSPNALQRPLRGGTCCAGCDTPTNQHSAPSARQVAALRRRRANSLRLIGSWMRSGALLRVLLSWPRESQKSLDPIPRRSAGHPLAASWGPTNQSTIWIFDLSNSSCNFLNRVEIPAGNLNKDFEKLNEACVFDALTESKNLWVANSHQIR